MICNDGMGSKVRFHVSIFPGWSTRSVSRLRKARAGQPLL